jgi:hypothetical protein
MKICPCMGTVVLDVPGILGIVVFSLEYGYLLLNTEVLHLALYYLSFQLVSDTFFVGTGILDKAAEDLYVGVGCLFLCTVLTS